MKGIGGGQPIEIKNVLRSFPIVTAVLLTLYFFKFDGNITGFFRIGSVLPLSPYLNPETTFIYQGELGYDGQQFLSLALDPFLNNPETVATLDQPLYRYRRILYPLISYFLGLGDPRLIPYVMVGINYSAIFFIIGIVSLYFKFRRGISWHPLLTLCIPGVWIVLSLSTADLLSSLLLLTAIYCYERDRPACTSLALALGCLTRETMLLMWMGFLITSIVGRKKQQIKYLMVAWIPAFLWNLHVANLNLPGFTGVEANFGYPFVGVYHKYSTLLTGGLSGKNVFEFAVFTLTILIFFAIFYSAKNLPKNNSLILALTVLLAIMFSSSSMAILNYYLNYLRVYLDVYFLLLLGIDRRKNTFKMPLISASGLASIAFLAFH